MVLVGKSLAVYTPNEKITTCEILPGGKYVVLAMKNDKNLITLKLVNSNIDGSPDDDGVVYGSKENDGKVFELTD